MDVAELGLGYIYKYNHTNANAQIASRHIPNQKYIFTISLRELSVSLNSKKYKNPHANDQIQANI